MAFEVIGLTGFAGDRTPHAMRDCHAFANRVAEQFGFPVQLFGEEQGVQDLPWQEALVCSEAMLKMAATLFDSAFTRGVKPLLVTPRCATATATLPRVMSHFPDAVVVYFDAHGDLNTPQNSSSSYLGGMPIAAALGEWDSGYGRGLTTQQLVHVGARELDQCESDYIQENNIATLSLQEIETDLEPFEKIIKGRPVFVHIDTDVFDPSEVVAEYAVPDGLFRRHVDSVFQSITKHATLIGVEITEMSPTNLNEQSKSHQAMLAALSSIK